jgi:hypothetical protein
MREIIRLFTGDGDVIADNLLIMWSPAIYKKVKCRMFHKLAISSLKMLVILGSASLAACSTSS